MFDYLDLKDVPAVLFFDDIGINPYFGTDLSIPRPELVVNGSNWFVSIYSGESLNITWPNPCKANK